jgi:hypothetical protein
MVADLLESRDLATDENIPVEVRARVEAIALYDALQAGDYASAAHAQERLQSLGWHVSREPARTRRTPPALACSDSLPVRPRRHAGVVGKPCHRQEQPPCAQVDQSIPVS